MKMEQSYNGMRIENLNAQKELRETKLKLEQTLGKVDIWKDNMEIAQ